MSGHSKWATTHRQKESADAKKGAIFTKLGNLITIAAKEGGGDLTGNFKLRLAVEKARTANMLKDKIEKAIKRGTGELMDEASLEEVIYEAFGPAGSAFVIEAITNNKNRTISEIKNIISKNGGQFSGANSVLWQFERKGQIIIENKELENKNSEELELALIDAGAQDIVRDEELMEIYTAPEDLQKVAQAAKGLDLKVKDSGLAFVAKEQLNIASEEAKNKIQKLYGAIDDLDDVSNIYTNAA